MPTWRLDLSYDGGQFRGYAKQDGLRTVQGELEAALGTILGSVPPTSVAGRTDAGVHAKGQVVSFAAEQVDESGFVGSLNGILGPEIAVLGLRNAEDDFSARFSAKWRRYRYRLDPGPVINPLRRHDTWTPRKRIDLASMQATAEHFVGENDFTSFCRSVEGKSNVRRVQVAEWLDADGCFEFWIEANAFCHQMVRSLVGLSFDVGRGFTRGESVPEIIEARDRGRVATVAPAHGLTLWEVGY